MKKITTFLALLFVSTVFCQTTYINENFDATDVSGGSVLLAADFARFNYSAFIASSGSFDGNNDNASLAQKTNAIVINNNSASSRFIATTAEGQISLRANGAGNYANDNAGIYFLGLDLTDQEVLNFSFQIRGGPISGDTDLPATFSGWSINLNFGNTSNLLTTSDSYFVTSENVIQNIPFDINDGTTTTTNQTSFDIVEGQWITISGSIDLTGKTLGTFAAFQIHTDTGGFISGGKPIYLLDNVSVTAGEVLATDSFELDRKLKVFPNPTSETLHIVNASDKNIKEITMVNLLGKTVLKVNASNTLDVSSLKKGVYFLKVNLLDVKKSVVRKIVVY